MRGGIRIKIYKIHPSLEYKVEKLKTKIKKEFINKKDGNKTPKNIASTDRDGDKT